MLFQTRAGFATGNQVAQQDKEEAFNQDDMQEETQVVRKLNDDEETKKMEVLP